MVSVALVSACCPPRALPCHERCHCTCATSRARAAGTPAQRQAAGAAAAAPAAAAAAAAGARPRRRRLPCTAAATGAAALQELPDTRFIFSEDGFLASADRLRQYYDEKIILDPLRQMAAAPQREQAALWNAWDTLPEALEQYSVPRTAAKQFFPPRLYRPLKAALVSWGERVLGCRGVSPIWLSYYTAACTHTWQCAAPHGPFAFTLSLTRWDERGFCGGETMLLQPDMLATDEVSVFEPRFNSLLCWDARVPVGVRQVEGSDDALDARVVLHGYFGRPAPFASGSLAQQDVEPVLQAAAGGLHAALQRGGHQAAGLVTVRLEVAPDGRVAALRWLCNTLIAHPQLGRQPWVEVDAILSQVAEACLELRFPASRGGGEVTLPLALA